MSRVPPTPRLLPAALGASLLLPACGDDPPSAAAPPPEVAPEDRLSPADLPFYEAVKDEIRMLRTSVATRPDDAGLRADLGEKLLHGLLVEAGEAELRRALELDPGNEKAALLLFQSRFERGGRDDALAILRGAIEARDSAALRAQEGRYLTMAHPDDPAAAEAAFLRALEIDRASVDASFELARLYLAEGRTEDAIPLLESICRRRSNHLGAWYNLSRALRRVGRVADADEAAATHHRLAQLDDLGHLAAPDTVEASISLAYMRTSGGDFDGAQAELARAIARHGELAALLSEQAFTRVKAGDLEGGVQAFESALKRFKDDAAILNRFAWVLATQPRDERDRKRARNLAERALAATNGRDPDVLDTVAVARLGVGDRAGALAAMREAVRLRPGDAELARRLEEMERGGG